MKLLVQHSMVLAINACFVICIYDMESGCSILLAAVPSDYE